MYLLFQLTFVCSSLVLCRVPYINIDHPSDNIKPLHECITDYLSGRKETTFRCRHCNKEVRSRRIFDFMEASDAIIVNVHWFDQTMDSTLDHQTLMNRRPLLNISGRLQIETLAGLKAQYELIGAIHHIGMTQLTNVCYLDKII